MPSLEINGGTVVYETFGEHGGLPVVLTPGGRHGRSVPGLPELARGLADRGLMAVTWDRRNTGASDVAFEGASESHMWADDLAALVKALDLGPVALAGGSAGSRVSVLAAIRHPELVSRLALWWVSGGLYGHISLASHFGLSSIQAVMSGGMAGVSRLSDWGAVQQANPGNRERLLGLDPDTFLTTMKRWLEAFLPTGENLLPGVARADIAAIRLPTLIFRNEPTDATHPAETTDALHALLADSTLVDPPWTRAEWPQIDAAMHTGSFAAWERLAEPNAAFCR